MKRLLDISGAVVGLVVLAPLFGLLWVAVVMEAGVPGLFRQRRVGRGGRDFVLLKFRSMTEGKAESRKSKVEIKRERERGKAESRSSFAKATADKKQKAEMGGAGGGADGGAFDAGDTSRVTAVGRVLRKTKLDELPQLWNVLKGDMSLVGPRPEVRKWVEAYPERWAKVLSVRPGITDPASIEFRNEEELLAQAGDPEAYYRDVILPRKLDLYEEYVAKRSLGGDISIMFKTVFAVVLK